jgi:L-iditol 2-dehydrogenase
VRALVLDAAGDPRLAEVAEPEGEGEIVSIRACGLCGTDVAKIGRYPAGAVLGHEVVGDAGGGRVALVHHLPCGECDRCRSGHESTCEQFRAATIVPGGFAERVRAKRVLQVPAELDDATATFAEPLACVLRAIERVPRGRVLVVGCGFSGLLFVQALVRRGDDVFALDPLPERMELAQRYGARAVSGAVGAAVLCAHAGLDDALQALEPGGTLVLFSWFLDPVRVDLGMVLRRELSIVGAVSATPTAMERALELLPTLDRIPTVTLPLDRFAEGLDLYRRHQAVKVVFTP